MDVGKVIRFGIIGCGDIAPQEAEAIRGARNAELVMAMDTNPEYGRRLGDDYGIPHTSSLDEILSRKDIDAVVIAVPHNLHGLIGARAAAAGKHIVIEKPIAASLDEADALMATCRRNGVALSVAYCLRYRPRSRKAREIVAAGAIGRVIHISSSIMAKKPDTYWSGGYTQRARTHWRSRLEESGGGVFLMNSSHSIDCLHYITGLKAERVYAEYGTLATPGVEVEDIISATVRYAGGAVGSFTACSAAPGDRGWSEVIYGTDGAIEIGDPLRVFVVHARDGLLANRWNELALEGAADPWIYPRARYIEAFADALIGGGEVPIPGEEGKEALALVTAAYESGRRRAPVAVGA